MDSASRWEKEEKQMKWYFVTKIVLNYYEKKKLKLKAEGPFAAYT